MDYNLSQLMIVAAAREIRESEIVFVGMRLPLLAFLLSKQTHARNAIAFYENGVIRKSPSEEMLYTMSDPPNLLRATSCTDMLAVMGLLQQGRVDLGFIGGAEIDRFGNLNTTYVGNRADRFARLPGSGGACDIASLANRLIIIMAHEKRRFKERVSYITSPGYGNGGEWREQMGLARGGPSAVITTKGVLRFDLTTREAYLASHHPGISVEEIKAETGWELKVADNIKQTEPPTEEELRIIRQLDPQGFWTA